MRRTKSPTTSGVLVSALVSERPNGGRSTAMIGPSAANISHVGRNARMLSGSGLSSKIGSPSFLPFVAKRICNPSMVLYCIACKPVLLLVLILSPDAAVGDPLIAGLKQVPCLIAKWNARWLLRLRQRLMNKMKHNRSFTYRRSHTFYISGTCIPNNEHAWQTRFKHVRRTGE